MSILWISVFNPSTTGGQMWFQIRCFAEECVKIRSKEGLECCCDVAHVANFNTVSQQPNSTVVFLHPLSSEFTYIFSIHNVYLRKKSFHVQKFLNNWIIVHLDSLELKSAESIQSFQAKTENRRRLFSSSSFWFTSKRRAEAQKKLSCHFRAVLCSPQKWNSWLCEFPAEVQLRQRHCNPYARLWVKQQIIISLSCCRISTLFSSSHQYMTRWRQFSWLDL